MSRPGKRVSIFTSAPEAKSPLKESGDKGQSKILNNISKVLSESKQEVSTELKRRKSTLKTFRSSPGLFAFDGDIDTLQFCISSEPALLHEKFTYAPSELLSTIEQNDQYYVPPLPSTKSLREALSQPNLEAMSHDQVTAPNFFLYSFYSFRPFFPN